MPDILQDFPIAVPTARVFQGLTDPALLDQWWTLRSSGQPVVGALYELDFGPGYHWRAEVIRAEPAVAFAWRMCDADADWAGTQLSFVLSPTASGTQVQFSHRGWPEENEHFRISSHCWALYLRLLRRHLEFGEIVPYERRLDV